jgi:tripartite-type tricarboxylate transporter receptor subunit TctC
MKVSIQSRRIFALRAAVAAASLAFGVGAPRAATWPEKPINVIVPAAAGSSLDQNVRRVMEEVGKLLKQTILIDNRPGGGGAIALPAIVRAAPDGYTLGMGNTAALVITPEINPKARYGALKDFEFIARFTDQPNVLVVRNELPVKTVAELTQHLKKNPGKLFMGSQGNGSTGHLSGEMFKRMAGVDFVHVPYRSGPPAMQDMLGGRVDLMFENIATIEGQIEAGRVRALAVTSAKRNPRFPALPTMQEAGVPGYEVISWSGLIAPAGTPKEILARLNQALNAALKMREVNSFIVSRGAVVEGGTAEAFKSFVASERTKWQTLIKDIGGVAEESAR